MMNKWNKAGYISKDAVTDTTAVSSLIGAGTLVSYGTGGKPGIRAQESAFGTPVTLIPALSPDDDVIALGLNPLGHKMKPVAHKKVHVSVNTAAGIPPAAGDSVLDNHLQRVLFFKAHIVRDVDIEIGVPVRALCRIGFPLPFSPAGFLVCSIEASCGRHTAFSASAVPDMASSEHPAPSWNIQSALKRLLFMRSSCMKGFYFSVNGYYN